LQESLCRQGIEAIPLGVEDGGLVPPDAVLVISDIAILAKTEVLRDRFASSRVLLVPVAAFDPATSAAEYTVQVLLASDFAAAIERNRRWREALERLPSPLVFADAQHPGRELRCHLLGDLTLNGRDVLSLEPGEWVAAAEYFEVEMESFGAAPTLFSVEGQISVSGVLAAKGPNMPNEMYSRHDDALRTRRDLAMAWRRGVLWCEGNKPVRFEPDDVSAPACDRPLERLLDAAGPEYGGNLLEFSIGTNVTPGLALDWSVNSCMNEGVRGIHVAIGDGICGAHVDFVSAGAEPQLVS
jgi:hypothetical protein